MSLHPPHLLDSSGSLTPAALIPFCAYQTNMTLLGKRKEGLKFTVCSKFKATLLDGQLCYSLNLSSIQTLKSKPGEKASLMIFLDEGATHGKKEKKDSDHKITEETRDLDLEDSEEEASTTRIYLNTLSSFTGNRAGSYLMSSLKKMTGTSSFLGQTDEQRNCATQTYEDCRAQTYIEKVKNSCNCVPWALSSALSSKVCDLLQLRLEQNNLFKTIRA